jgi:hypothetical protein
MYIHIVERENKFLLFGYNVDTNKKLNKTGPANLIATTNGYVSQAKNTKPNDYVCPSTYYYGYCENTPQALSKTLSNLELSKLIIDKKASKLYRYMLSGSVFNGFQDEDFTFNIRDIANSSFNILHSDYEVLDGYVNELITLSEHLEEFKLHEKSDINYWAPKSDRPYWLFGNTLIYMNNGKLKAYVSVTTSLDVKKEDVAVKNNNIHKVLSDTNYTISLESDSKLLDRVIEYKNNELNIPLLISPTNLFHKDVIRSLGMSDVMVENKYYNCDEVLALNGKSVSVLFSPPGLLFKMQTEVFRAISMLLVDAPKETIDIKPYLIDDDGKIKKEFNNTELIKVPYKGKSIIVKLGTDTLPKNNLNKIYKDFDISLAIISNGKAFKYFTIIDDRVNNKKLISYAPFNNKGLV